MQRKIFEFLSTKAALMIFMCISIAFYTSLLLFEEGSPAWKLWWAPSKALGLLFALLCLLSLTVHLLTILFPFFEKWFKKR